MNAQQIKATVNEWSVVINGACVLALIGNVAVGAFFIGQYQSRFVAVQATAEANTERVRDTATTQTQILARLMQTEGFQRKQDGVGERIARIEEQVKAIADGVRDLQTARNRGR